MKIKKWRSELPTTVATVMFLTACILFAIRKDFNADTAISSFIGQDIALGNIFLKDWVFAGESYFTTDYLWHGVLYWFLRDIQLTGYVASVLIICFSFITVLLIAKKYLANDTYIYVIPLYIILIVSIRYLFLTPNHHATIAICLLAAYFYFSSDKIANIGFIVLSFMAIVGDKYALIYLILPLLIESAMHSCSERRIDRRLILILLALLLAFSARYVLESYYYKIPGVPVRFVEFEKFFYKIELYLGALFKGPDAWFWGGSPASPKTIFQLGLAILPLASVVAPISLRRSPNRVVRFLCLSSLCVSCAFIFSDIPQIFDDYRYLFGLFFNGIILIAVLASEKLPVFCRPLTKIFSLSLAGIFLAACFLAHPSASRVEARAVAVALAERGLSYGYAYWWAAYPVRFAANGALQIAPIELTDIGYAPSGLQHKRSWYTEWPAYFVLRDDQHPNPALTASFDEQHLRSAFGEPAEIFRVGSRWTVYVYDNDLRMKLQRQ